MTGNSVSRFWETLINYGIFKVNANGVVTLDLTYNLDKYFWDYVSHTCLNLTGTEKVKLQDWFNRKQAMGGDDLHAVTLMDELELILGS